MHISCATGRDLAKTCPGCLSDRQFPEKLLFRQVKISQIFSPFGFEVPYYPTSRTFIHHTTYVKEGVRVINGYINRTFITSMLWVRGVHGGEHLSLVGSYCLLSCHHDDVMMIAILILYMYQLMFKNRLPVLVIGITCTVTLSTINTVSL